jgi:hypothetical protein
MKIIIAVALSTALAACSQKPANQSGNAATPAANTASGNSASANSASAAAPTGQPAAAYKAYFDERWAGGGQKVTPAEVEAMLSKQTPQQVVNALWGQDEASNRWDTVSSGIAKGDPAWLALAPRIAAGTDAGTSLDFGMAVQDLVTVNAPAALRLMVELKQDAGFCNENGVEVPAEQARAYFQAATAAVEAVNDPALQQIKGQCLAELRKGMAEYPGLNGNPPQKL